MKISEFISESAIEMLRRKMKSLKEDMIFRGIPDENGIVTDIEIIVANEIDSIASVLKKMKKNEAIIRVYPRELVPSDTDVKIAQIYGEAGGAFYIINVDVSEINAVVSLKKFNKIKFLTSLHYNYIIAKYVNYCLFEDFYKSEILLNTICKY